MFTLAGFVRASPFYASQFFTEKNRAGKSREQQCDDRKGRIKIFIKRFDFKKDNSTHERIRIYRKLILYFISIKFSSVEK